MVPRRMGLRIKTTIKNHPKTGPTIEKISPDNIYWISGRLTNTVTYIDTDVTISEMVDNPTHMAELYFKEPVSGRARRFITKLLSELPLGRSLAYFKVPQFLELSGGVGLYPHITNKGAPCVPRV